VKGEFKFVLNGVRPDAARAVAEELTRLFPLDLANAANVIRSAPIILLDKLTAQQARRVGTYAVRLRALGADVAVTGQPVPKLQVLRWPLLPDIAKRSGHHVICPNCGARLQVQMHVPTAEVLSTAAKPEPEAPPPEPPVPEPEPVGAGPPEDVVLEEIPEEEEVILEEGSEPGPRLEMELEPAPAAPEPKPKPRPVAKPAPTPAAGPGVGGEGACRVMIVGKIKGKKKQKAADLMAEYLGIGRDEALAELSSKNLVTVARDLTVRQAEQCEGRFAAIDVKVNIKG